jgi:hypothetical protein
MGFGMINRSGERGGERVSCLNNSYFLRCGATMKRRWKIEDNPLSVHVASLRAGAVARRVWFVEILRSLSRDSAIE